MAAFAGSVSAARAQGDFDAVEIRTIPVAPGLYMMVGLGGNLAVSAGADGVFLVDDQFAPLTRKIRAAIAAEDTHAHLPEYEGLDAYRSAGGYAKLAELREGGDFEAVQQELERRVLDR